MVSPGGSVYAAAVRLAAGELVQTERVGGKQTVGPHVPAGGETKTAGMIEDGDADRLAVDRAVVVDPRGRLAPRGRVHLPPAVDDLPPSIGIDADALGHADAKRALLGVAEGDRRRRWL